MQPTSGSQRVLQAFSWLRLCSAKLALSRPAHQRVTQTVDSTQSELSFSFLWVEFFLPDLLQNPEQTSEVLEASEILKPAGKAG